MTYINANVTMHCEKLANEYDHQLVFTPAYHSDLQPIKIVWAWMKGAIGSQCKKGDGLANLEERLIKQFATVCDTMGAIVGKIIEKAAALTHKMWLEKRTDDEQQQQQATAAAAAAVEEVQPEQQQQQQLHQPIVDLTMNNGDILAIRELLETGNHVLKSKWPGVNFLKCIS